MIPSYPVDAIKAIVVLLCEASAGFGRQPLPSTEKTNDPLLERRGKERIHTAGGAKEHNVSHKTQLKKIPEKQLLGG
jgi:hypothetical protein